MEEITFITFSLYHIVSFRNLLLKSPYWLTTNLNTDWRVPFIDCGCSYFKQNSIKSQNIQDNIPIDEVQCSFFSWGLTLKKSFHLAKNKTWQMFQATEVYADTDVIRFSLSQELKNFYMYLITYCRFRGVCGTSGHMLDSLQTQCLIRSCKDVSQTPVQLT